MNCLEIKATLSRHADPVRATSEAKYLRNLFVCFGIPVGKLGELVKPFYAKNADKIDRGFVGDCYAQEEREMQYVANDYLFKNKKLLTSEDLSRIMAVAQQKSWWDTIDTLSGLVGEIVSMDESQKQTMIEWSLHDDFWVRRLAILHQLYFKTKTDTNLLATIIKNNLGEKERSSPSIDGKNQEQNRAFFINKAIGWALREYSKTDEHWVRQFIDENRTSLSKLSIREGLKWLENMKC